MHVYKYMFKVNNGNARKRHGNFPEKVSSKNEKYYVINIILVFLLSIPKNITTLSVVFIPNLEQVNLSYNR